MNLVLDTSAIMAVIQQEPDASRFEELMLSQPMLISMGTRLEMEVTAQRRAGPNGIAKLTAVLGVCDVELVPVDKEQFLIASMAFARFGRGRGLSPSALNFGDLFAYALAKAKDLPLLYKGDDFAQTDIRSALEELGPR